MRVARYRAEDAPLWDDFVRASRNGTFLFQRAYMDYHADRFADHSVLVFGNDERLVAIMPASTTGPVVSSHGGLSYGGVVVGDAMTAPVMVAVMNSIVAYFREQAFRTLRYKTIPSIYHRHPAEEDRYALFRVGASLCRRDVLSVVSPGSPGPLQERRKRSAKKARSAGVEIRETTELGEFWSILTRRLSERHATTPVHTLSEIELLRSRFPASIRMHGAFVSDRLVAGTLVYESPRVAHAQYIASNDVGRETGALDALFMELIETTYAHKGWFDFGISTTDEGRALNVGLIQQKEGFGARSVVHDFYSLDLTTVAEQA